MMRFGPVGLGGALMLGLCGCAVVPPSGPSVMVMPGQGKSFEQFQADDAVCRQAAWQASGGQQAAQAATNNVVGAAAVGTAVGAAAGALVGSAGAAVGGGAAVGAGVGLLAGSAAGANAAQASSAGMQQQYDVTYIQCMASKGHQVPQTVNEPGPEVYPYAVAPYYYGPGFYYPRHYYRYYP